MKKWNDFLSDCKEAWETEGVNCSNDAQKANSLLLRCDKSNTESLIQVASKAYELMIFGCNFNIIEAHSGNNKNEIKKVKKIFYDLIDRGEVWGQLTDKMEIQFSDINSEIKANVVNEFGEKVCDEIKLN
ncbi:hypothetical protein [uncultured Draconibacterium sp.]|uniref:hypothetical protein n=1 Tax=uncultured Draconibacterium sp. TaxID=1573823 RepID=UPI0025E930F6|nr:hypothetical protein [uncultured Draconibacterium sp.]